MLDLCNSLEKQRSAGFSLVEFIDLLIFNIVVRAAIVSKNSLLEFNESFLLFT